MVSMLIQLMEIFVIIFVLFILISKVINVVYRIVISSINISYKDNKYNV